ncbi:MAG: hypothetical protein IJP33_03060, partial [Firmicutes bacterium]|nr:hypothetical protein [Bacillota bacterium]
MKLRRNFSLFCFILLLILMLIFPAAALQGASSGLTLWWEKVLPALLPFFMLADIIMNLGGFEQAAKGMSPLCRKVFHLPGEAGAAIVLGFTSGFPTGAAVCASLLDKNSIAKQDAERLICFTNNAGPLFITITVCTAVLDMPQTGIFLLAIHYGISLIYGIISARFVPLPPAKEYETATAANTAPLGVLLKNAAVKAVSQISLIGCYLIFFSLLCTILSQTGFFAYLGKLLAPLLQG